MLPMSVHLLRGDRGSGAGGLSHTPIFTPLPPGQDPTPAQQQLRIHAFRMRTQGYAMTRSHETITSLLRQARWDLDTAVAIWQREIQSIRQRHRAQQLDWTDEQMERDWLMGAVTIHQNHRRAVDLLWRMTQRRNVNAARNLPAMRAAMLLRENHWDPDLALAVHFSLPSNPEERRRREREERRLRVPNPNLCHQDQRVALFLEIAGTDDWVSARAFLVRCNWDLAVAIDRWMQHGLPVTAPRHEEVSRSRYEAPTQPHIENDNLWQNTSTYARPIAGTIPTFDPSDLQDARYDYGQGPYAQRLGWLIGYDINMEARAGVVCNEQRTIRAMRKGRGTVLHDNEPHKFGTNTLARADYPKTPGQTECFDWYDPHHVSLLNKWRGQILRRTTGYTKRPQGVGYSLEEEQWIYDWHAGIIEETLGRDSTRWPEDGTGPGWPVYFDYDRLTREFNRQFTGRTDLDPNGVARADRTKSSLMAKQGRIRALCKDFDVDYKPPRRKRGDESSEEE